MRARFLLTSDSAPKQNSAPGHTPGHAAVTYDLDNLAIQSRKRILDMAATERFAIAGAYVNAPRLRLRGAQGRELRLRARRLIDRLFR
jgi:hypothetical protein